MNKSPRTKATDPLMATADKSSSSWSSDCANGAVLLDLTSRTDNVPSPLRVSRVFSQCQEILESVAEPCHNEVLLV